MNNFHKIYKNSKRNIVLHNVFEYKNINQIVNRNDLLFFDDCTHDQYEFILKNNNLFNELNINCVISFSTNIYRNEKLKPLSNIPTFELHNQLYNDKKEALNGFMSISEIKNLLNNTNIFLGLHGHNHLELKNVSKINQMMFFKDDLEQSITFMKQNSLKTDIFVYPYDFIVLGSEKLLKNRGFKYIFPSKINKRTYIEEFL